MDSGNWPTAELNPEATGLYSFSVEDARTLVDADARMRSSLALDCSWLLGAVPAD